MHLYRACWVDFATAVSSHQSGCNLHTKQNNNSYSQSPRIHHSLCMDVVGRSTIFLSDLYAALLDHLVVHVIERIIGEKSVVHQSLVGGWFCEAGGCGLKGAVREFIKISNDQEEGEHTEKGLLDILVVLLN